MNTATLALSYLRDRWINSLTTIITLGLGVGAIFVLLTFAWQTRQHLEQDGRRIDAVVGAKGSPLQLVLSSVYHADMPPGNISLETAGRVQSNPLVRTGVPLALGDTYRAFRIAGTETGFLDLYGARLKTGSLWAQPLDVVLGAEVARQTGLGIGANFVGSHGLVADGGEEHSDFPYTVTGILAPTGTVADRLILTSLESVWKVHGDHEHDDAAEAAPAATEDSPDAPDEPHGNHSHGLHDDEADAAAPSPPLASGTSSAAGLPAADASARGDVAVKAGDGLDSVDAAPLPPLATDAEKNTTGEKRNNKKDRDVTALLVTYNSPSAYLRFPQWVNRNTEAQAASPAIESARLFDILGIGLDTIRAFALVLIAVSLLSIFAALYSSLQQRQYDLAVMRALGAPPRRLLALVLLESALLTVAGILAGFGLGGMVLRWLPHLDSRLAFLSGWNMLPVTNLAVLAGVTLLAGLLAALLPARQAYRTNVAATLAAR